MRTLHEVSGRQFSLLKIREDHLKRMSKLNVLRKLNVEQMDDHDVQAVLQDNGEFAMYLFCN